MLKSLFSFFSLGLPSWSLPDHHILQMSARDLIRVYTQNWRLQLSGSFFHHFPGAATTPNSAFWFSMLVRLPVSILLFCSNHPICPTLWLKAIKQLETQLVTFFSSMCRPLHSSFCLFLVFLQYLQIFFFHILSWVYSYLYISWLSVLGSLVNVESWNS